MCRSPKGVKLCPLSDVVQAEKFTKNMAKSSSYEAGYRLSTADVLIDLGFGVIEARTSEEALRLLKIGMMPNLLQAVPDCLTGGEHNCFDSSL